MKELLCAEVPPTLFPAKPDLSSSHYIIGYLIATEVRKKRSPSLFL